MRRLQILVVMVALLATPLALLARAMACESATCTMMCCLPHGSHSHSGQTMPCHCSTKPGKQLPDFGLIAPIAPTMTEDFTAVALPGFARQARVFFAASITQGFAAPPFSPPKA